jgi:hypothetical protein
MALDLAGGPLLPEEDGEWVEGPRSRTARTVATAGLVAAEAALLVGDPLGAAAAAATGLDHDPYDEAALRALMRAHVAAGRPASALAAYADVRSRLAEDLGVSPSPETEALHEAVLGDEPVPAAPPRVDGWDPLVQRARVELASYDVVAARRDAEAAVRRGGGPGALELAGWVAYYQRDFSTALRWAEEAAERTDEDERRASCLTLAGRVRHSVGDLAAAEASLTEATRSPVAGVRAMGEVWLGALRAHQGRPAEALELVDRGAIDAAALRHPFVLPHAMVARAYALGQQGRVAELFVALDAWDRTNDDLGDAGHRFGPPAANFRSWALGAIGRLSEAEELSQMAHESTVDFDEARLHAVLDLASLRIDAGDDAGAAAWLEQVAIPDDDTAGTMVWHQRQRVALLRSRLALRAGDPERADHLARSVAEDSARRGSARAGAQAGVLQLLARAAQGHPPSDAEIDTTLAALDRVAGLEAWRSTAQLAAATGSDALRRAARRRADALVQRSGDMAPDVARWTSQDLWSSTSAWRT